MPDHSKSPRELVERFHAVTAGIPDAEHRQMFGYPAMFVGGNHVTGLHLISWVVRLAGHSRAALRIDSTRFRTLARSWRWSAILF